MYIAPGGSRVRVVEEAFGYIDEDDVVSGDILPGESREDAVTRLEGAVTAHLEGEPLEWQWTPVQRRLRRVQVVCLRHQATLTYLRERWPAAFEGSQILPHATAQDVRGKHVLGVLPLHLAAVCRSLTVLPLDLSREDRGVELTLDRVRELAGTPVTYRVQVERFWVG